MLLSDCKTGRRAAVLKIDTDVKIRRHLLVLGIFPGASVHVVRRSANGSVIVCVSGTRYALGQDVASKITVLAETDNG